MMGNSFTSSVSRMLQQHAQQRISRQRSKADALGLAYLRCFAAREFERGSPGAGLAAFRLTTNIVPTGRIARLPTISHERERRPEERVRVAEHPLFRSWIDEPPALDQCLHGLVQSFRA